MLFWLAVPIIATISFFLVRQCLEKIFIAGIKEKLSDRSFNLIMSINIGQNSGRQKFVKDLCRSLSDCGIKVNTLDFEVYRLIPRSDMLKWGPASPDLVVCGHYHTDSAVHYLDFDYWSTYLVASGQTFQSRVRGRKIDQRLVRESVLAILKVVDKVLDSPKPKWDLSPPELILRPV